MPSPFPGMDPYLENPALWPNVYGRLIVAIADDLSSRLLPKYQPVIEESVYQSSGQTSVMVGVVELPALKTFRQRFIEIRNTASQEVVTVIEVLSPANKRGEGRSRYQEKRSRILESQANLVEIDFLHKGAPMPTSRGNIDSHYRILVSSFQQRPQALLYPFNLSQPLPQVPIPLRPEDDEPNVNFQALLNQVYERSGYGFSIDYIQPPKPGWSAAELDWMKKRVKSQTAL
ncbi:MAG: DUF4058 family protein [Phormidesmis sp.]